jgi:hypothetical protein
MLFPFGSDYITNLCDLQHTPGQGLPEVTPWEDMEVLNNSAFRP